MRGIITYILLIVGVAMFALSCKHEPPEAPPGTGGGGGGGGNPNPTPDVCDPDSVYFAQSILPLIVSSCAIPGCHDPATAEDDVVLNNYANIFETGDIRPNDLDGSDLYEVITDDDADDRMPPAGDYPPLSSEDIALIRDWILQGAPNNSCNAGCDTTNVTYTMGIGSLISAKCQGCHSGANPQGGILLTNYSQVSSVALMGNMLDAVQHTGNVTPMPFNSTQLPECEIDLIRIWIENGAPE